MLIYCSKTTHHFPISGGQFGLGYMENGDYDNDDDDEDDDKHDDDDNDDDHSKKDNDETQNPFPPKIILKALILL